MASADKEGLGDPDVVAAGGMREGDATIGKGPNTDCRCLQSVTWLVSMSGFVPDVPLELGVGGDTFTQVIAISSLVEIFGSEAAEMLPIAMRTELL